MADLATTAAVAAATTPAAAAQPATTPTTAPATTAAPTQAQPPSNGAPASAATAVTAPAEGEQSTKDAAPVVPDKYEFKLPEGQALDPTAVEKFTPVFQKLGLPQDKAQEIVSAYNEYQSELIARQTQTWLSEAKADKDIGGAHFEETAAAAQKAFAKYGNPQLKQFLEATGLGNHTEFLRMFAGIGKAMSEDTHVSPGTSASEQISAAKVLFPSMK